MQIQAKWITYDKTKPLRNRMPQFSMSRQKILCLPNGCILKRLLLWVSEGRRASSHCWGLLLLCSKAPEDKDNVMCICVFSKPSSVWLKGCLLTKLHIKYVLFFPSLLLHSLLPHHPCPLELPKERDHTQPWVK